MTTQLERPANLDEMPMLIGGELVPSESGRWLESTNPATGDHLGSVPLASAKDVDRAVAAAEAAQPAWAALSGAARAAYLYKLAAAIEARGEEILRVEVMDTGNTIRKMRSDVGHAVGTMRYYAGLACELKGQSLPAPPGNVHFTVREPYGVVGRIIPFNHPIQFAVAKWRTRSSPATRSSRSRPIRVRFRRRSYPRSCKP